MELVKDRYPDDVSIINTDDQRCLKTVEIGNGIPVILKYYGFDNQLRIEIGSYLSGMISDIDYMMKRYYKEEENDYK